MKGLDLPSLRIPFELFNSFKAGTHRQIGKQFPVDPFPTLRFASFLCMNRSEDQFRIPLFFVPWRTNHDTTETHLKNSRSRFATMVAYLEGMEAAQFSFFHLRSDRCIAIAGQPIDAGSHQKMRS